ncbi:MAG: hypothetical protein OHK0039_34970 [Bacteroidia bacterium]
MKRCPLTLALCLLSLWTVAQVDASDDVQVTAHFSSSLDLRIVSGATVNFVVATMGEYSGGVASPYNYFSDFTVTASVNYRVAISSTDFSNGAGETLAAGNFGYRLFDNGTHSAGVNYLLLGAATSPSPMGILGTTRDIITPLPAGNAGPPTANAFRIHFELGTPAARALSGLPTLLEQSIVPGQYTGTVTLTVSAEP